MQSTDQSQEVCDVSLFLRPDMLICYCLSDADRNVLLLHILRFLKWREDLGAVLRSLVLDLSVIFVISVCLHTYYICNRVTIGNSARNKRITRQTRLIFIVFSKVNTLSSCSSPWLSLTCQPVHHVLSFLI